MVIIIMYTFSRYFSLFLVYAFLGWIIEVALTIVKSKKAVNRGFLMGPIVPIWGVGALLITFILKSSDGSFNLVVSSAFIGSFLEYIVNYFMEKIFKARWWDYSHLPFNVNGRIWLGSSLAFGIGGLFLINYFNPFFMGFINLIDRDWLCIICTCLFAIFVVDFIVSCNIIKNLKLTAYSIRKDYTEEVSKKVKLVLEEKSRSFRRLLKAFPDVRFHFKKK